MTESNESNAAVYPSLSESLEAVRPEMAALEPSALLQIVVDPVAAVGTARGAMPQIRKYREVLVKLPDFKPFLLDKLPIYASAALQAHTLYLSASAPPERFQALVGEATALRDLFLSDSMALAHRNLIDGHKLDALKGTTGHRNIASDLLTLYNMLRTNWPSIATRTAITEAELARAEVVGNQLVGDIGMREQSPAAVASYALARQQTYTLLVNGYDEVRRSLTYVRWYEDDVDKIAPSLFGGKRRRTSTSAEPTTETLPTGTPTTTPSANTAPYTAVAATNKPGIGMPGSDPFGA